MEHLVTRNPDESNQLKNHARKRDRLGNLAMLSSSENRSEGNRSYAEKYEDVYADSSLATLRGLAGPRFGLDEIEQREREELIPFIRDRWG